MVRGLPVEGGHLPMGGNANTRNNEEKKELIRPILNEEPKKSLIIATTHVGLHYSTIFNI